MQALVHQLRTCIAVKHGAVSLDRFGDLLERFQLAQISVATS
jgi:hypothetical protein